MSKILSAFVAIVVLAASAVYGVPVFQTWYQTHEAQIEVAHVNTLYSNEIATAKANYRAAVLLAQQDRDHALTAIKARFPRAELPRTIDVSDVH